MLGGKAARLKSVYLLPPISGLLVLRHSHPSSLNADQDRPGQKIGEGGVLRRLHMSDLSSLAFSKNGYVDSSLVYDNSNLYGLYYTYSGSNFTVTPEIQYMYTPVNTAFGVTHSSSDISAMIHADYYISDNWSIAGGIDYEKSSSTGEGTNATGGYFGYGPGSSALGVMITPTYTDGGYFIRDELSFVRLTHYTNGFGANNSPDQFRDILETGFWF